MSILNFHAHRPSLLLHRFEHVLGARLEICVAVVVTLGVSAVFFLLVRFNPALDASTPTPARTHVTASQFWLLHDAALLEPADSDADQALLDCALAAAVGSDSTTNANGCSAAADAGVAPRPEAAGRRTGQK